MKKISAFLILLMILNICTVCFAFEMPETVKIGLFYGSAAKDTITISNEVGVQLYDGENLVATSPEFTFSVNGDGKLTTTSSDTTYIISGDALLKVEKGYIAVNSKKYRGSVLLKVDKNKKITVINDVNIEEYLYSVLPKEMSTGFPFEALKAQAVCARTYTACNMGKFKEHGFDLTDNTLSQVYGGVSVEADDCTKAVNETKGMIVTYNGKPAETFYYASSSGNTLDVKDVWGSTTYPYLISVPDTYQSVIYPNGYTWEVSYTADEVTKLMKDKGYTLGKILDITIDKTTPQGAVTSLTFTGEHSSKTFTLGNTRTVLNLKSQVFKITKEYAETNNQTTFMTNKGLISTSNEGYVLSAKAIKKAIEMYTLSASGISKLPTAAPQKSVSKITVKGSGYGHGIGMSQNGAKGMAKSGFKYNDIITHYFPGCVVE